MITRFFVEDCEYQDGAGGGAGDGDYLLQVNWVQGPGDGLGYGNGEGFQTAFRWLREIADDP